MNSQIRSTQLPDSGNRTPDSAQCNTCAHSKQRYRHGRLMLICTRYDRLADVPGCLDYRSIKSAINKALDYLKRASIK